MLAKVLYSAKPTQRQHLPLLKFKCNYYFHQKHSQVLSNRQHDLQGQALQGSSVIHTGWWFLWSVLICPFHETTPCFLPVWMKALTQWSMSSSVCAAEIWTRILALPFGTTGKEKPITYTPVEGRDVLKKCLCSSNWISIYLRDAFYNQV